MLSKGVRKQSYRTAALDQLDQQKQNIGSVRVSGGNELPNPASGSQLSDRSALSLAARPRPNISTSAPRRVPVAFELRWKFLFPRDWLAICRA